MLREAGWSDDEALVVLRLGDVAEWFADDGEGVVCRREGRGGRPRPRGRAEVDARGGIADAAP